MKRAGVLAAAILLIGCSSSQPLATTSTSPSSPAPAASPAAPSPSPNAESSPTPLALSSPVPLPIGTPVARRVLAPATELPVAALCSYRVYATADGNFRPLFCHGGAINVLAWKGYIQIGPNVMSLRRGSTLLEVEAAMYRDGKYLHATKPEAGYSYEISAAYHGWKFAAAISAWQDGPYDPNHPLC
jgi:hypothetical protein